MKTNRLRRKTRSGGSLLHGAVWTAVISASMRRGDTRSHLNNRAGFASMGRGDTRRRLNSRARFASMRRGDTRRHLNSRVRFASMRRGIRAVRAIREAALLVPAESEHRPPNRHIPQASAHRQGRDGEQSLYGAVSSRLNDQIALMGSVNAGEHRPPHCPFLH